MNLGALLYFLGIGVWVGSPSALGLTLVFTVLLVAYLKGIEEPELAARFGEEYLKYKRRTPFLFPRLRKRAGPRGEVWRA